MELLCDQKESDFVQCQTKMRAFASGICSEFKQIELNWKRIVYHNALWSLVFSTTRQWNKQISAPDASQPSSQERWQVADLKHLKTSDIFSLPRISTKDFPYIKGKIDWSIGIDCFFEDRRDVSNLRKIFGAVLTAITLFKKSEKSRLNSGFLVFQITLK